jgi:3',5'-cyclic AMP phosphodiesterase CpdA
MNQSEDSSSSPYPCNKLANARTRRVIAELNRLEPSFVVHLGDIVNPVPELPTYGDAAGHFKTLTKELKPPLHVIPGNHDVGDKPVSWMPAGTVSDANLALYERHFGRHFYSFDFSDLHLVVINSPVINSGLAVEAEQAAWLEADLAANRDKRTFLFTHYPPYVSDPAESGSYDNIDEPGRSWLLGLIEEYRPEAVFCGHVHNFWYDVYGKTEVYLLPSTAFVRHDYSEFFRVEPGDQFGRNDEPKLGYFVVRVYETGHVAENIRTYGRTLAPGERLAAPEGAGLTPVHTKESALLNVGVDMRHPWAEEMEIAPSGALDEFERKIARNDYPVLALWEMGLRRMRVPIQDLLNPRTRRRMEILQAAGHLFQVYGYGLPADEARSTLAEYRHLVDRLELVIDWGRADELLAELRAVKEATGLALFLSRVNRKDGARLHGTRFNHLISHGFTPAERDDLAALQDRAGGLFDGFLVSARREEAPWTAAAKAAELAADLSSRICLYLKSTEASPAQAYLDDASNAARVAEGLLAGIAHDGIDVVLDSFTDSDRGYFARTGLVDRRYNPRLAGRVVSHLLGLLDLGERRWEAAPVDLAGVSAALTSSRGALYLVEEQHDCEQVARSIEERMEPEAAPVRVIHLGQDDMTGSADGAARGPGPRCLWVPREAGNLHPPGGRATATA